MQDLLRYSIINKKNPREIVLLRGRGCEWKKCSFCDYHLDCSKDVKANFSINKKALDQVTGMYHSLEVINSGSFTNLDTDTIAYIQQCCADKKITSLRFECHWLSRNSIKPLKELFRKENVIVKIKMGVESFNVPYREQFLNKGMGSVGPEEISKFADEVCLLQGIEGQTEQSMKSDIETGLQYFERVCVNIMTPNTTSIHPDLNVQRIFREKIAPLYIDNSRVDILFENTDFGVGGKNEISK